MSPRIQTPPGKAVFLTTVCCAAAGGITELLMDMKVTQSIGWWAASALFSIAVLLAFRKTVRMTILRVILMPILMFGIFYGAMSLMLDLELWTGNVPAPWTRLLWDWTVWFMPGMATVLIVGIVLRLRLSILNVLIGGFCSWLACFLAFMIEINSNSIFAIGPIFILWQTLVGFSCGLLTVRAKGHGNVPGSTRTA